MLYEHESISIRQTLHMFIGKGFTICEIWNSQDYTARHILPHTFRQSMIATRLTDNLIEDGISKEKAQQLVLLQGDVSLTKKNLEILGKPIALGSIDELSNNKELWELKVQDIHIKGFLRRKLIIILEKER